MKKLSAALDSLRAMATPRGGRKSRAHRQMHFLIHTRDPRLEQLEVRSVTGRHRKRRRAISSRDPAGR